MWHVDEIDGLQRSLLALIDVSLWLFFINPHDSTHNAIVRTVSLFVAF
ncbi:hypothetical protein ND23_003648 [Escherichia coli]|nr:hypothetical protein [Escherichia coli]